MFGLSLCNGVFFSSQNLISKGVKKWLWMSKTSQKIRKGAKISSDTKKIHARKRAGSRSKENDNEMARRSCSWTSGCDTTVALWSHSFCLWRQHSIQLSHTSYKTLYHKVHKAVCLQSCCASCILLRGLLWLRGQTAEENILWPTWKNITSSC